MLRSKFTTSTAARFTGAVGVMATMLTAAPGRAEHFYQAWVQEYDRSNLIQGQTASAVAVDSRGNVIVTGNAPSAAGFIEWYTAKYDGLDGHLVWSQRLGVSAPIVSQVTPTGDCFARSVAVDSQDNVIVTGGATFSAINGEDIETVKYSPDGIVIWARSRNGSNSGADEAVQVVIGPSDGVYVGGTVITTNGFQDDFQALGYSSSGTLLLAVTYDRTVANVHCVDKCRGIAVNASGQVWLTGSSSVSGDISFLTVKIDTDQSVLFTKVYTSPGAFGGATGIVLDSAGTAFVTGKYTDASGSHGFHTEKYGTTGITFWTDTYATGGSDHAGGAQSIAIGPDGNPVVTGAIEAVNGSSVAVTVKYQGAGASTVRLWAKVDSGLSPLNDQNQPQENTLTHRVFVDGANNVAVIGESSRDQSNPDVYLAKYSGPDGGTLFATAYSGDGIGNNTGVDIVADAAGNLALAATEARMKTQSVSLDGIATLKLQRILAETGDSLPEDAETPIERKIAALYAPALADSGAVAVRISYKEKKKTVKALLTELGAGGASLPVSQNDDAPNLTKARFSSFGEPVVSQDGHYAFPAKLSGVAPGQANSVWTNFGGALHLALQQGSTYGGLKIASISSISLHDAQLVALVKASGGVTALLGLDAANNATVLLKTGTPVTLGMATSMIKSITVLSPAAASPGDGRWQGISFTVAKATLQNGTQLLYRIAPNGAATPMLFTGQDSPIPGTGTWKSFGLPAIAPSGAVTRYAALGTFNKATGVTPANDGAIVYSFDGTNFSPAAREGDPADAAGLIGLSFDRLSDPIINAATKVAFLTTLKATPGSGASVSAKNHQALIYGTPGALQAYVRTGASARDSQGNPITDAVFSSIKTLSLSAGRTAVPSSVFFVATLSGKSVTPKSNAGLWAIDRTGKVRLLLRSGQTLGDQTVKSFTLLKAVPGAFAAQRSVNANSSVVALVNFTNHATGIVELLVP